MDQDLIIRLAEAGIVHFGLFDEDAPLRFNLELLPAYPDILDRIGEHIAARLRDKQVDRLVCRDDSFATGVCASLKTGLPLAYRQPDANASGPMIGAYDTGHVTALIANTWLGREQEAQAIQQIVDHCTGVGLELAHILTVIGVPDEIATVSGTVERLITVPEMIETLTQSGHVPARQAAAATAWLARQR